MIDYGENNLDMEIDKIFEKELLDLEVFLEHSELKDESKFTEKSSPSELNSFKINNYIPLEVELEKLNSGLNKLISGINPAGLINNYKVTENFISKYMCGET